MKVKFTLVFFLILAAVSGIRAQKLWGVASSGVADNKGVIFNANSDGTGYAVQHNFVSDFSGSTPMGSLTLSSGFFYGMTSQGGDNALGMIFKYEIATGGYTKLHSFQTSEGTGPAGSLLLASNGKFYGLTNDNGGGGSNGTIFEFDPSGNTFTKKVSLTASQGQFPNGSFVQATANSKLYALVSSGGANGVGTIIEYDIPSGTITFKYDFVSATDGSTPMGDLVEAADGMLYGMTSKGGANSKGTLFSFNPTTHAFTTQQSFTGTTGVTSGSAPAGSLARASDGFLYGLTGTGGANNKGVLFRYDNASNTYVVKKDFADAIGSNPQGTLMQASNGKLYGTTLNGGGNFLGTIFEYDISGDTFTKKIDLGDLVTGSNPLAALTEAPDGILYGLVPYAGPANAGVLYQYDKTAGTFTNKISFSNSSEGSNPLNGLSLAGNGMLYGVTSTGGTNGLGTVFEVNPANSNFIKKADFSLADGSQPSGGLTLATNGKFYGTTSSGGTSGDGILYEYDPGTTAITKKFDFAAGASGNTPTGTLCAASNGKLYGTTSDGGPSGQGVIYEFDPSTGTVTPKFIFPAGGNSGANPNGGLAQGSNGKLYGMTNQGGALGKGVFYQYDPIGQSFLKLFEFTGSSGSFAGAFPTGEILQSSNGKLYGLTSGGGANDQGALFEYDYLPAIPVYSVKYNFASSSGSGPKGALVETSGGVFFGTTAQGGANSAGVIFKYALSGGYTNLKDLGGANGAEPQFGSLLLVPAKQTQTITFGSLPNKQFGDPDFALSATASSGLTVTYISSDPSIATVTGNTVHIANFGTVTITAMQGGNASYFFAPSVNQTLTISRANQTISFTLASPVTYATGAGANITLNGTATSGLDVTYVSSDPTITSIVNNVLTINKAGSVIITAQQAGNAGYNPAPDVQQTLVIDKANQIVSFAPPPSPQTYGTPFTITVTVTSGLPITFSPNLPIVNITGTGPTYTVTPTGTGTITITASQPGNGNYNPAADVRAVTIDPSPQTMTFTIASPVTYGVGPITLNGTATSGLPVSYAVSDGTVASISNGVLTILKAGSVNITPSQAGDANYLAAPSIGFRTLVINKATQTITFNSLPDKSTTDSDFALTATTNSSSPVTYTSSNPSVATIVSGNMVHIVGAGSTDITANAIADVNYNAASPVVRTQVVNTKLSQTITFNAIPSKKFGSGTFTLGATASSGLAVSYSSGNPSVATISGNVVTITGVGISTITASQVGDATYNAASPVIQDLVVTRGDQTITFSISANPSIGQTVTLNGTSTSGLPVSYTLVTTSKGSITGNTLTASQGGLATVTAAQLGNANYNAATSVNASFCIKPPTPTITVNGQILTSSSATGNVWTLNGVVVGNAETHTATKSGAYTVQVNVEGCLSDAATPQAITGDLHEVARAFTIYPNPSKDRIFVDLNEFRAEPVELKILDLKGQALHVQKVTGGDVVEIGISDHASGLYILLAAQGDKLVKAKYVKGQ